MHRSGTLHGIRLIQLIPGIFPVIPNMHYVVVGLQGYANFSILHEKYRQRSGLLLYVYMAEGKLTLPPKAPSILLHHDHILFILYIGPIT